MLPFNPFPNLSAISKTFYYDLLEPPGLAPNTGQAASDALLTRQAGVVPSQVPP